MRLRTLVNLSLAALLTACGSTMLPAPDVAPNDVPVADRADVSTIDRPLPEDTGQPRDVLDSSVDEDVPAPFDATDVIDVNIVDTPTPPFDALDVITTDVPSTFDAPTDTAMVDGGLTGCIFATQPALAVPTPGTPTVVMNTWSAGGSMSSIPNHGCSSFAAGSDHIYPITIATRTTLQFVLTADVGSLANPMMSLRRSCSTSITEVACDLDSGPGNGAAFRVTLDPGTYYLVADEYATSTATARGGSYTLTVSVPNELPSGTCANATPWMAGTTASGTTNSGGTTDRSCNPTTATGPETFFRYTLPANTRSMITATPLGMPAWRTYLRIREDCTTTSCITTGQSATDGAIGTVTIENRTGSDRTFIVSVGSWELGTGGAFTLSDSLTMLPPVPPNAVCSSAPMVGPVTTLVGETTAGTIEARSTSCSTSFPTGGTLAYYRMNVPAGRTMVATVTPSLTFDPALRIFVGCSATSCGAYRNSFSTGVVEQATYRNTTAMDQDVIIAVGSVTTGATGTFDLSVRLLPAFATNTTCATARPLSPAMPALAQNQQDASEPNALATCEATATGNVLYYTVNVPPGETAILRATPYSTTADAVLRVTESCASMTCLTSANSTFGGGVEEVFVTNGSAAARDYIVTLGSRAPTSAGVFDLTVRFATLATNATCAMPRALTHGELLTMQDSGTGIERRSTTCSATSPSGGPLLYYQVTVPANRTGVVRVTPRGSFDPAIRVFAMCTSTSCTHYRNSNGAGVEEVQSIVNSMAVDQSYLVAIGGVNTGETGLFDLSFNLTSAMPTNTTCATARPLSPSTPALLQNQASASEANALAGCEATATGNVLYYSLTVPAGQTAIITATPLSTTTDPVLRVAESCASMSCLASSNSSFGGGIETVFVSNSTASPRDYIVTLGSRAATSAGVHDVTVRFVTAPTNASCSSATPLSVGVPITMQDTGAALERRLSSSCATTTSGAPLLYYAATVPANTTARVRVTPSGSFNGTIRVFQTCAPTTCTSYRDAAGAGMLEEAVWRNGTATAQTYIIAIGGSATNETGTFSIELDLPPDPYLVTRTMSASCEDLSAGTVLPIMGDDSATGAPIPLPFTFSYFGDTATHWGANTNGLMQLFAGPIGSASTSFSNTDLSTPNSAIPGGLAIFWDDLTVNAPAVVRHATIGPMGSRRFVLEWFNVSPLGSATDIMRFQIKLSEGSNIIEYHYCAASGSTRSTGDSATIGIQNIAATRSLGVSFNMAGSTAAGTLVRFIPR